MPLSSNAPFNEFGQSMVLRDIEQIYLMLGGTGTGSAGDGQTQDQAVAASQEVGDDGVSGTGSGSGTGSASGVISLSVNTSDATDAASVVLTGTFAAQSWTVYEKRPRFNAKWMQGKEVSSTAPTSGEQFLKYNATTSKWEPYDSWSASAVTGWLNCYDSTLSDDIGHNQGVMAGTALSVFCRASNSDGLPAGLAASSNDTILGRRSNALTFAKVARGELEDGAAVSIVGRSANSSGAVADIAAASNDTVLGRRSNALTFAKLARAEMADGSAVSIIGRSANSSGAVADIAAGGNGRVLLRNGDAVSFSVDLTLGTTSGAGTLTIANATSATAISLATTLINAAGKVMSVREIDVCDAGTAKKMLVLASAPY